MKTSAEHQANRSAFVTCSFIFALLVAISILSIMVGAVRLSLSDIITAISGGKTLSSSCNTACRASESV